MTDTCLLNMLSPYLSIMVRNLIEEKYDVYINGLTISIRDYESCSILFCTDDGQGACDYSSVRILLNKDDVERINYLSELSILIYNTLVNDKHWRCNAEEIFKHSHTKAVPAPGHKVGEEKVEPKSKHISELALSYLEQPEEVVPQRGISPLKEIICKHCGIEKEFEKIYPGYISLHGP